MIARDRFLLSGLLASCVVAMLPAASLAQGRSLLAGEPSELERTIERAMAAPVSLSFHDDPLEEVVWRLEEISGLEFALDRKALADAGLGPDAPVTLEVSDVTLRAALSLALNEMDLCWAVKDEVLLITSKTAAEGMLAAKIYDVADLVSDERRNAADFRPLLELIATTIAPTTWDEVGGAAAITSLQMPGIRAIVVSQSEESHYEIQTLLDSLRRLKKPVAAKASKARRQTPPRIYAPPPAWAVPRMHD